MAAFAPIPKARQSSAAMDKSRFLGQRSKTNPNPTKKPMSVNSLEYRILGFWNIDPGAAGASEPSNLAHLHILTFVVVVIFPLWSERGIRLARVWRSPGNWVLISDTGQSEVLETGVVTMVAIHSAIGIRDASINDRLGKALIQSPWPQIKSLRLDPHDSSTSPGCTAMPSASQPPWGATYGRRESLSDGGVAQRSLSRT
jgi:hypothetical protein